MEALAKWTVEDYHRIIEAGILCDRHVELLAGEIIKVSPESPLHSDTTQVLADYLRKELNDLAKVREAHPITLQDSEPETDLAIVKEKRYNHNHPRVEDIFWLIEVSQTTLAKDKNQKKKIYAAGIQEYWIIDLHNQELIVWRKPYQDDYQTKLTLKQGIISPVAFDEVELEVKKILPN